MSIVRTVHENNFTIIANGCLRDDALSAESLGVLCYLLGKPDDWTVRPTELAKRFDCGRERMDRILKELIEARYILKERTRDRVTGLWRPVEYVVFQMPQHQPHTVKPSVDENPEIVSDPHKAFPSLVKPAVVQPSLDFQEVLSTDLPRTDLTKDCKYTRKPISERVIPAVAEKFFADQFWPNYPKRAGSNPKEPARKKIVQLIVGGENPHEILDGLRRLVQGLRARQKVGSEFVPMAVTWINRKGWLDDPEPEAPMFAPAPNGHGGGGFFAAAAAIRRNAGE